MRQTKQVTPKYQIHLIRRRHHKDVFEVEIGLPMSDLITHRYPLEEINEALKTNLAMQGLKIAIINK